VNAGHPWQTEQGLFLNGIRFNEVMELRRPAADYSRFDGEVGFRPPPRLVSNPNPRFAPVTSGTRTPAGVIDEFLSGDSAELLSMKSAQPR